MKHVERIQLTEEEMLLAVGRYLFEERDSTPFWVMDWCVTNDGKEGKSDYGFDWDFYKGKLTLMAAKKDESTLT